MQIEEILSNNILTINFIMHGATYHHELINCAEKSPDEIFNEKLLIIRNLTAEGSIFLKFSGREKELIKTWAKVDKRFEELYKKLYPHGGWRNGGRPKGTDKTTMLKVRITPDEEKYLLENF